MTALNMDLYALPLPADSPMPAASSHGPASGDDSFDQHLSRARSSSTSSDSDSRRTRADSSPPASQESRADDRQDQDDDHDHPKNDQTDAPVAAGTAAQTSRPGEQQPSKPETTKQSSEAASPDKAGQDPSSAENKAAVVEAAAAEGDEKLVVQTSQKADPALAGEAAAAETTQDKVKTAAEDVSSLKTSPGSDSKEQPSSAPAGTVEKVTSTAQTPTRPAVAVLDAAAPPDAGNGKRGAADGEQPSLAKAAAASGKPSGRSSSKATEEKAVTTPTAPQPNAETAASASESSGQEPHAGQTATRKKAAADQRSAEQVSNQGSPAEVADAAAAANAEASASAVPGDDRPEKATGVATSVAPRTSTGPQTAPVASTASSSSQPGDSPGSVQGKAQPRSEQPDQARFVQRVSRAFEAMGDRNGSVRLRLSPPELGSLRLEISMRSGTMNAKIEAETPAARNVLLDSLPALQDRLAQQGIKVERFDVELADRSPTGTPGQTANNAGSQSYFADRQAPSSSGRAAAAHTIEAPPVAEPNPIQPEGNRLNVII